MGNGIYKANGVLLLNLNLEHDGRQLFCININIKLGFYNFRELF